MKKIDLPQKLLNKTWNELTKEEEKKLYKVIKPHFDQLSKRIKKLEEKIK